MIKMREVEPEGDAEVLDYLGVVIKQKDTPEREAVRVGFSISIPKFISRKSNQDGRRNHCFAGILPVVQNRN
jgi:hypothetical protein